MDSSTRYLGRIKNPVKNLLKRFDLAITGYSNLQKLYDRSRELDKNHQASYDLSLLSQLPGDHAVLLLRNLEKSKSQIRQDLFVLSQLSFKRNGFFVEFGATNGIDLSNTHLLEKEFGWTGILAEPAKCWHEALRRNRDCSIETKCVWRLSGESLTFNEVANPDMSTIQEFSAADEHRSARRDGTHYKVDTISLVDLLIKQGAPNVIDYLSIDTEGSEFEILSHFDFDKYRFQVITCEHNFGSMRENIFILLSGKGYVRRFSDISQFDDWYVSSDVISSGQNA